ncbi:MAG: hypothetical protein ABIL58_15915 [Pseudomonadota bacterium]
MTNKERKRLQRPERLWSILLRVLGSRRFLVDTGRYETFGADIGKEENMRSSGRCLKKRLQFVQALTYNQKRRQDHE